MLSDEGKRHKLSTSKAKSVVPHEGIVTLAEPRERICLAVGRND